MSVRSSAFLLLAGSALFLASGAELVIPDACDGAICLTEMRWKKGTVEHTFTGFIVPRESIESVELHFEWSDDRQKGENWVRLRDINAKTSFYFKLFGGGLLTRGKFRWDTSTVRLTASAVF